MSKLSRPGLNLKTPNKLDSLLHLFNAKLIRAERAINGRQDEEGYCRRQDLPCRSLQIIYKNQGSIAFDRC